MGGRKLGDNGARVWKIKRQTLEDLFSVHTGDNGLFNTDLKVIESQQLLLIFLLDSQLGKQTGLTFIITY